MKSQTSTFIEFFVLSQGVFSQIKLNYCFFLQVSNAQDDVKRYKTALEESKKRVEELEKKLEAVQRELETLRQQQKAGITVFSGKLLNFIDI